MAYGITRLNAKRSQPNPHIVFIKPMPGPDEEIAQDFLERIAAQCLPIMKEHTLSVMSLEQYPPNREFVGRNFNAGEVIQLVLKSPSTGRWLPFEYVQMVMMHELAHCKQMNHSKAFWAVRNNYATQMYGLMRKGYTGEGIWGRGQGLGTGEWAKNTVLSDEVLPEHLCGGTYRSRGRKRKAKGPELTWKEKKERRVLKKFGANGQSLGSDEGEKVKLEKGKKVAGKPRVAGSARGRELRAAAALARFDKPKEEDDVKEEVDLDTGSESDYEDGDLDRKDAVDLDGSRMLDQKGRSMIKICEDEEADDPGAKDEFSELRDVLRGKIKTEPIELSDDEDEATIASRGSRPLRMQDIPELPTPQSQPPEPTPLTRTTQKKPVKVEKPAGIQIRKLDGSIAQTAQPNRKPVTKAAKAKAQAPKSQSLGSGQTLGSNESQDVQSTGLLQSLGRNQSHVHQKKACGVCTFLNDGLARRCEVCSNILEQSADTRSWACRSDVCRDKGYVNAGDYGICGLCGARKPS